MLTLFKLGLKIALALLLIAYLYISYSIAAGVTKAERKAQEDNPANYGLNFQDVQFISRRGDVTLNGWYIPGNSRKPTIIFVHGISGTRSTDKAVDLASRLVIKEYNVLLFDLRGHGDSEGEKISGGYFEQEDVLGAFDYLVERGTPPQRIGLIGFSMGAGISILAAAKEPAIQAVVADSPFANASELIAQEVDRKTVFAQWVAPIFVPTSKILANMLYGIDVGALVPEEAVKRFAYPILVIHGTADQRIPPEHGTRVYKAAHPDSVIWLVPGVEHVDAFLKHPDEYVDRVVDYFNRRLGTQ
ncbi:MAG: alpha/beta fold hydrolase [Chloroflexi bacterium]|nr:alpha/beta fold hydrolase [Chloroflexota bacterium]